MGSLSTLSLNLSHVLALFLVSFILMAPYTAFILKLVKKSDLRTATLTGIVAGILSNPGLFAYMGQWI
ncbi:predicted coding region AF_1582 [Archaeoglobus fulgidus DSM 4304]|uniref:Uncharacterized protein AF_1582 n=1 Tax=Archaeoglobus fulgidus (strain ATCC 49558 / DSM 4304 / JCM 9628 / NBRC 100126 / VC-16) TaxID=224325 RepID=Y1582_ARCFU|nr:hypothetical protein [Archaeoglobus fulgidus]O28690.1 RecName: Full=Uncharacterized protein AF_1582 [Archaeoglobus fulgidus DSM 4304]AAB89670.1 predicted coding region AF_1582 [Archaeoglobus fulgidus DSM 4304]